MYACVFFLSVCPFSLFVTSLLVWKSGECYAPTLHAFFAFHIHLNLNCGAKNEHTVYLSGFCLNKRLKESEVKVSNINKREIIMTFSFESGCFPHNPFLFWFRSRFCSFFCCYLSVYLLLCICLYIGVSKNVRQYLIKFSS